jgi:hypothetical protein
MFEAPAIRRAGRAASSLHERAQDQGRDADKRGAGNPFDRDDLAFEDSELTTGRSVSTCPVAIVVGERPRYSLRFVLGTPAARTASDSSTIIVVRAEICPSRGPLATAFQRDARSVRAWGAPDAGVRH